MVERETTMARGSIATISARDSLDRTAAASIRSAFRANLPLLLILGLALGLRIYWLTTRSVVITTEGADYARQGENLLHGKGFRGIMGHQELLDPPGYALLIAGVTFVVRNSETATKIISVVFGVALILPLYFICLRIYGRSAALFAAILAAIHPIFLGLSTTAYSESVYIPLVMAGVFFGLAAAESGRPRDAAIAGAVFACAYLTRQEAIPFVAITGFWILVYGIATRSPIRRLIVACSLMTFVFALLAAPYVVYLTVHTGHARLEAKNGINYFIAKKQMDGIPHRVAAFGIDNNLEVQGPMLDPDKFVGHTPPMSLSDFLHYARRTVFGNAQLYFDALLLTQLGSPFLLFLVILGLFQKPWDASRLLREAYLLSAFSYVIAILLLAHMYQTRYELIVLPFLTIWAGNGLATLMDWGARTTASLVRHKPTQAVVGIALAGIATASVAVPAARAFGSVNEFAWSEPAYLPVKAAGLWLKNYEPGPKTVMADASAFVYYADGTQILFPVADAGLVLRYIALKHPDFIVMYYHERWGSRSIATWFDNGIPDPRAHLIYDNMRSGEVGVRIYRWSADPTVVPASGK
jgi:4-amino-4-deoxy-L-arabinose transferase-like glycosyltransferase